MIIIILAVLAVLVFGMISVFGERSGCGFVANVFGGAALFTAIPLLVWGSFLCTTHLLP